MHGHEVADGGGVKDLEREIGDSPPRLGKEVSRDPLGQTKNGGNGLMRENISPSILVAQWEHKPQQSL